MDALDAEHAQQRRPQELAQIPGRLREVLIAEPPTGLEHPDPVALLGQPERGNRATEARADDRDIEVEHDRIAIRGSHQTSPPSTSSPTSGQASS